MLSEARRRQAQRYALIGQATEDLDEVHLSIPHAWLQLTLARPGAGLCGCGSSGRGGGGGGGRRRRWAGPAAIIAANCSAVTGTCSAVTAACPALAAACSAVTAACRDAGHACSGSRRGAPRPGTRPPAAQLTASAYRRCDGPCDGSRTCSTSRCLRRHRSSLPS